MHLFFGYAVDPCIFIGLHDRHRSRRPRHRHRPQSPEPSRQGNPQFQRAKAEQQPRRPSPEVHREPRQHPRGHSQTHETRGRRRHRRPSPEVKPVPQSQPRGKSPDQQARGRRHHRHHRRPSPEVQPGPQPHPRGESPDQQGRGHHRRPRPSPTSPERAPQPNSRANPQTRQRCCSLLRNLLLGPKRPSPQHPRRAPQPESHARRQQRKAEQPQREPVPVQQPPDRQREEGEQRAPDTGSRKLSRDRKGKSVRRKPVPEPQAPLQNRAPHMNMQDLNDMYLRGMQPPGPQQNDQQYAPPRVPGQQPHHFSVQQQGQQGFGQPQSDGQPFAQQQQHFADGSQQPLHMPPGLAQALPNGQQYAQQGPVQQPNPFTAGTEQQMPPPPPGFVQQPQQPQFSIPGAAAGYFQRGEQQPQQAAVPMDAHGVAFGGPPVGAPPGSYPEDGAWANVSEVNPPGISCGYDREERRQERQRAQRMRDAELLELDQQLEALRAESDRDLERILAITREDAREVQEEQFRRDMHAGIIASKQHEMWEYQQGREQARQSQGPEYRVNMMRDLQLFIPRSSSARTSLSDLQE